MRGSDDIWGSVDEVERAGAARDAANGYLAAARDAVAGSPEPTQRARHGLAWIAATVEALATTLAWATPHAANGPDGAEWLVARIVFGEYLAQLIGGLPISQSEIVRPADLGAEEAADRLRRDPAVAWFVRNGSTVATRRSLADALGKGEQPSDALDADLDMVRDQFRRFSEERILPLAHQWHLADDLIPDAVVLALGELGVFGVSVPVSDGGLGLGKLAMCVVSEELARGWVAAGSLGTRSEIAAELIATAGTAGQRAAWLPGIASGEILAAAVFTEPGAGSDLGSVRTVAAPAHDGWRVTGAKTWITHAARSDLMIILARTQPSSRGSDGISIFLAAKPRGTRDEPFPVAGLSGGEIPVIGYRGMREYDLAFDDFAVPRDGLLGGVPGQGFRQLMSTFESARIQTAARAVGVARRATELALAHAKTREQFGNPLLAFDRVADKLATMAAETIAAREATYAAARRKDAGRRCDMEAGMAKLLAARAAWSAADAAVQIHGGTGFATEAEISRILADARIFSIFEGASEIQAEVVGRRLLERRN